MQALTPGQTYLLIFFGWILAATSFTYVLLATSSQSPFYDENPEGKALQSKEARQFPQLGDVLPYCVIVKQGILIFIFRRLCHHTMEPLRDMADLKEDTHRLNRPRGVLMTIRRATDRILSRDRSDRWFSTFLADHILLLGVGTCFFVFQILLAIIRLQEFATVALPGGPEAYVVVGTASAYVSVLVTGFLMTTLEHHAVPRAGREKEFLALMSVALVLWAAEFLVLTGNRSMYLASTVPFHGLNSAVMVRVMAAAAGIFVTHSCVMLGAVLCGHSCHFKKCPDLQWTTLGFKILPCFAVVGGQWYWIKKYTQSQLHPVCEAAIYRWAKTYPYVLYGTQIVLGTALLAISVFGIKPPGAVGAEGQQQAETDGHAQTHVEDGHGSSHGAAHEATHDDAHGPPAAAARWRRSNTEPAPHGHGPPHTGGHDPDEHHRRAEAMNLQRILGQLFDYDAVLVLITFSGAIIWNIVTNLAAKASTPRPMLTFFAELLSALAPVGLAIFVLCAWRRPASKGSLQAHFHWLAFLLAATSFNNFQYREDCEITAPLPMCCGYPGMSDWNKAQERFEKCNVDERCSIGYFPAADFADPTTTKIYCLPKAYSNLTTYDDDGDDDGGDGNSSRRLQMAEEETDCSVLKERWDDYRQNEYIAQEIADEATEQSTAYKTLITMGQSASVEFYFTTLGVLLKLILLAEHPNSEQILKEDEHHANHHGEVVAVQRHQPAALHPTAAAGAHAE